MSVRGVISDETRRSPSRKTLSTMSCSASSKTPASVPCSIMILISSSVTGGSLEGWIPIRRKTESVPQEREPTSG